MRRGGGKSKGSAFERRICVSLSVWISKEERQDLFWRSAMSGGRATVAARKGIDLRHQAGDISATHPDGHVLTDYWYVECKTYRDLQLDNFIMGLKGTLSRFWTIALREAKQHGRKAMLIAKQNRGPVFVIIERKEADHYSWTQDCRYANVLSPPVSIMDFESMLCTPYNLRIRKQ